MDTPTEHLRHLGLRPGWIYEAVLCTFVDGTPHAAPAGVRTDDGASLSLDLYDTSRSLRGLTESGAFAVDFPHDATTLATALHAPQDLRFAPGLRVAAPHLEDAAASVELVVTETSREGPLTHVRGRVAHVASTAALRLLNRAEPLLVESLILVSRVHLSGTAPTLERLREHRRVIDKVAPGSAYSRAMARLLHDLGGSS